MGQEIKPSNLRGKDKYNKKLYLCFFEETPYKATRRIKTGVDEYCAKSWSLFHNTCPFLPHFSSLSIFLDVGLCDFYDSLFLAKDDCQVGFIFTNAFLPWSDASPLWFLKRNRIMTLDFFKRLISHITLFSVCVCMFAVQSQNIVKIVL